MANILEKDTLPTVSYADYNFQKQNYDLRYSACDFQTYFASSGIKNVSTLRFHLARQPPPYQLNPGRMILAVELKVTNDEKTAPPVPGTEVSFINNTLSSLIRNFRLSFNNQVVSEISDYAIVSMVANRLNLNNDDFSSYLQVGNFFRDLPGQFDKAGKENTGWELRRMPFGMYVKDTQDPTKKKFKFASDGVLLITELVCDVPELSFLGNVDMTLDLELNSNDYVFHAAEGAPKCAYVFDSVKLLVERQKLNEKLYLELEEKIQKQPLQAFYNRTQTNTFSIPIGSRSLICDNIATGSSPVRMICLLQEASRYRGDYHLNSLRFPMKFTKDNKTFVLKNLNCYLANEKVEGLQIDDNKSLRDHYFRMFWLNSQVNSGGKTAAISMSEYFSDCALFCFDFTASLNKTDPHYSPLTRSGHLRLSAVFDEPTKDSLILVCIQELASNLTIHSNGRVQTNSF